MLKYLTPNMIKKSNLEKVNKIKGVSYFKIQYSFYCAMLKYLTPNVIKKSNLEKVKKIKVVLVTRSWHSI